MNIVPLGYDSVEFTANCTHIKIIDQTQLPLREVFVCLKNSEDVVNAIKALKVRGAPALGVVTAAGIAMSYRSFVVNNYIDARDCLLNISNKISSARPTAVNSVWAAKRMVKVFEDYFANNSFDLNRSREILANEALQIKYDDIAMSKKIAGNALSLLGVNCGVLTHCNAGHLATARYGTALAPLYLGEERGYNFKVYATETRPLLQGARLTTYELSRSSIDVTLICDSMVSWLMSKGKIDAVLVGCDRIAANGDVANKIGTSSIAIIANYYKIPFYVLGPESTIDKGVANGNAIVIEERDEYEVTDLWYKNRMVPDGVPIMNPAFDVTDSSLISAIITDRAIYRYPFSFS